MVLMSFSCKPKKPLLLNMECNQTIRPPRKNPIKVGDRLQIYWKVRKAIDSKDVHKIGEGIVTEIHDFVIAPVYYEGNILLEESLESIAKKDGFEDGLEFEKWFEERYDLTEPKKFKIIRWKWVDEE